MSLPYDLALRLKKAGFDQTGGNKYISPKILWDETAQSDYETSNTPHRSSWVKCPTLEELIDACGKDIVDLRRDGDGWSAINYLTFDGRFDPVVAIHGHGSTPQIAVALLYLALNEKV